MTVLALTGALLALLGGPAEDVERKVMSRVTAFAEAFRDGDEKTTRDGEPFRHRLRFTQVWIREAGEWTSVAFHDSRVAGPD